MSVGRICVREVDVAAPDESAIVAARRMLSRNVGTLVVVNAAGEPIGIVTDRDLTLRVLAAPRDPHEATVGEVMSAIPRTVPEDSPIETAIRIMRGGKFRRLPVVSAEGKLAGLVSLDDILELLTEELKEIGRLLQEESPRVLARA
jgi:CBS domain-containing protein